MTDGLPQGKLPDFSTSASDGLPVVDSTRPIPPTECLLESPIARLWRKKALTVGVAVLPQGENNEDALPAVEPRGTRAPPTAFSALVKGCDGGCPCCRGRFDDAG